MSELDELTTTADLARALGVSKEKVLEWRRTYGWPHIRIGHQLLFTAEQVAEIVERHTVEAATPQPKAVTVGGQTTRSAARRRSA